MAGPGHLEQVFMYRQIEGGRKGERAPEAGLPLVYTVCTQYSFVKPTLTVFKPGHFT